MKIITHENIPRWYALSWIANEPTIVLAVHQEIVVTLTSVAKTAPIIQDLVPH